MGTPLVSVLLVTYKGVQYAEDLARSLREQTFQDFEVVLVDNASFDGTVRAWEAAYPESMRIRSDRNLGFCGGNNLAARNARGKYLVLLNQDTVVRPGWLEALVDAM